MEKINFSIAILAGGKSSRMGQEKSLIELNGKTMIERIVEEFSSVSDDIFIITNKEELYSFLNIEKYQDIYKDFGPLGGIHSALKHSTNQKVLVISCDMPFVDKDFAQYLFGQSTDYDVTVPVYRGSYEPLFAIYDKKIVDVIESYLEKNERKIISFYPDVKVKKIEEEEISEWFDCELLFFNVNTPSDLEYAKQILKLKLNISPLERIKVSNYKDGLFENSKVFVPCEEEIDIFVNNNFFVSSRLSPTHLTEYIKGFLFSEGVVASKDDIKDIKIINKKLFVELAYPFNKQDMILTSGCFGGKSFRRMRKQNLPKIKSDLKVSLETIFKRLRDFLHTNNLYRISGGIHAAALSTKDSLLFLCEDIGRHSAVDKAIGWALEKEISDVFLFVTGRVSSEMAMKAIYFGIPIIVSMTAASNVAIDFCNFSNVTLIGYAKMNSCKIYTNRERILEVF
ncbi:Molybdopterin-guanine dinucleotide biosynthesis protein A [Thermodesulfobium narugense DSM 14796]|uniref:Multifunctional fusion protein n=1 Tax=Thermodesulfobium narugense DSM 14796 TaxID=747365 RepID=M1E798_9BACT|nr:Molybdopterin-guanine dinucleotide biosynthesis protein A [Thermodesulfobium narugense DSM 14796]